jgi:hypothetical protein
MYKVQNVRTHKITFQDLSLVVTSPTYVVESDDCSVSCPSSCQRMMSQTS